MNYNDETRQYSHLLSIFCTQRKQTKIEYCYYSHFYLSSSHNYITTCFSLFNIFSWTLSIFDICLTNVDVSLIYFTNIAGWSILYITIGQQTRISCPKNSNILELSILIPIGHISESKHKSLMNIEHSIMMLYDCVTKRMQVFCCKNIWGGSS